MAKNGDSGKSCLILLVIPAILAILGGIIAVLSSTEPPWWLPFSSNPTLTPDPTPEPSIPTPELTPELPTSVSPVAAPTPSQAPPAPISEPTPIPEPAPPPGPATASASLEIRKQGYILRVEGCRTTGEVGAVVCGFSIAAESERKELSLNGRDTFLVDATGQRRRASRMDFGGSGSATSARSFVNPGEFIAGEASFSGVSLEGDFFQSFGLGGYSYRDRTTNLTATFSQVPLVD